jgi:predicted DCC family thiol-disulfide oxidoreductase YuxK
MSAEPVAGHAIVLFDGVCNVCNSSVNFIIKRDARGYFLFAPLQSPAGRAWQERLALDAERLDTTVLIEDGHAYLRSSAALRIARRLGGPYPLLYAFVVVPSFLRDFAYNWFARRRYRWFGRRDACMAPAEDIRDRFLPD